MAGYGFIAAESAVYLVWRHPLADVAARAAATIGPPYTAICLITVSNRGGPTGGTWWERDRRPPSMLGRLFTYLGTTRLSCAGESRARAATKSSILDPGGAGNS